MLASYLSNYYDHIFSLFVETLTLVGVALGIALILALPIGFVLTKVKWLATPVLSVLGVLYSIPSLAVFAMLIPLVGLGTEPAIIALVAYSQLVLVRNVMVGFQSISPSVIEAARGMGLNEVQLFWKIQLPLALPIIIGGVRIATVAIIGISTIAAWINAGGIGELLFEGLYQNATHKIIIGTVLIAAIALGANQILLMVEKRVALKVKG
ncbi:ABC transporter permease [Alkalihalobacillus pseudalcaliphilus]|uniref:ABC transporter permease n=1 Tax=Alkalihalobacillus pseudalcaliphilus TaxID=79884 RepID=UPI00069FD193|nr:ABC transporter permease [Alkalihalobacillus pseudalcaliphilus]